jgi:hypothetical protein
MPNLTTGLASLGARKPMPIVTSIDLLGKRKVLMEDGNVRKVRERWAGC